MVDLNQSSNEAVVRLMGQRLERLRLQANITQADLAAGAGISLGTVKRAEGGKGLSLLNLVALLRALGKLSALDSFLPEPPLDPLAVRDNKGRYRQRASGKRGSLDISSTGSKGEVPSADGRGEEPSSRWTWGDEAGSD
jgi:putative transcriptional regulator